MHSGLLGKGADVAGVVGIFVCAAAGGARVIGKYHLLGYEAMTLFIGGMALMLFACLVKIHLLQTSKAGTPN